ncbi:MAG: ROK family protein [Candidatus Brocadiales bacterium]
MAKTRTSPKKLILGADVGGTNIKTVLVDPQGHVLAVMKRSTLAARGRDALIERLILTLEETAKKAGATMKDVAGVGVGFAGPLDPETGMVFNPPNLPGWSDVPLGDILRHRLKMPVSLDNDANMVALGEHWKGAGRGARCLVCLTLGTGVGGGIVLNGRVWHGVGGIAGEIGHMTLIRNGRRCACGNRGCLEAYASSQGLVQTMQDTLKKNRTRRQGKLTPERIGKLARSGDKLAGRAIKDTGVMLGIAIGSLANVLNPDAVVIGGGVSKLGELLLDPIRDEVRKRAFHKAVEGLKIAKAELEDNAGALGAARSLMPSLDV